MNIIYGVLIALIIYPTFGTLLYILVENLKFSIQIKVLVLTFGHPILSGVVIWFVCLALNRHISEAGVFFVAGSLLRLPFSDRKYLSSLRNESGELRIEYFSELFKRKTIQIPVKEVKVFTHSKSRLLIDKPSTLTVTTDAETVTFQILHNGDVSLG